MKILLQIILLISGSCLAAPSIRFHLECESDCISLREINGQNMATLAKQASMIITPRDILKSQFFSENKYFGLKLSPKMTETFKNLTANNIGKKLAIVVDQKIVGFPTIKDTIATGDIQINFGENKATSDYLREHFFKAQTQTVGSIDSDGANKTSFGIYTLVSLFIALGMFFFISKEVRT